MTGSSNSTILGGVRFARLTSLAASAAAFIRAYPIGAVVRGDEILRRARDHADSTDLLAADLLIDGR